MTESQLKKAALEWVKKSRNVFDFYGVYGEFGWMVGKVDGESISINFFPVDKHEKDPRLWKFAFSGGSYAPLLGEEDTTVNFEIIFNLPCAPKVHFSLTWGMEDYRDRFLYRAMKHVLEKELAIP